jgi:bifunctional DNA-binding transcriptional regulator/antitoxin component of YhaV-PrlF toxin-antitoxin module
MKQIKMKLGEGGQIVIPSEFLEALGLEDGDTVILRPENGEMRIFAPQKAIRKAQELVSEYLPEERSLYEELIAERRLED